MIFINLDSFQVPSGRKKRRKRAREKRVSLSIWLKKTPRISKCQSQKVHLEKDNFIKKLIQKSKPINLFLLYSFVLESTSMATMMVRYLMQRHDDGKKVQAFHEKEKKKKIQDSLLHERCSFLFFQMRRAFRISNGNNILTNILKASSKINRVVNHMKWVNLHFIFEQKGIENICKEINFISPLFYLGNSQLFLNFDDYKYFKGSVWCYY